MILPKNLKTLHPPHPHVFLFQPPHATGGPGVGVMGSEGMPATTPPCNAWIQLILAFSFGDGGNWLHFFHPIQPKHGMYIVLQN